MQCAVLRSTHLKPGDSSCRPGKPLSALTFICLPDARCYDDCKPYARLQRTFAVPLLSMQVEEKALIERTSSLDTAAAVQNTQLAASTSLNSRIFH